MSRIIIAAEYVDESQNSTGYFWSRIFAGLKADGFDVVVLRPGSFNLYESFEGNSGLLKRLLKQIQISFDLVFQIYKAIREKGIVFTGTNPTILLCLMPLLKGLFRFKWVLLVHDVFPDNLLAAGIVKRGNPLFKLAKYYFSWVYAAPDRLLCIGRDMEALLRQKTSGRARTVFVPNWASEDDVYPVPRHELEFFKNHGWEDHIVFQFFGNIGRVQGVDNLLKAISLVTAKNAAFVFIGGGAMVPIVVRFIEAHPSKSVKFIGPMPMDQKNMGLAMCDVALVSLEAGMFGLGVPSKSYFSLAAGKPILAAVDAASEVGLMLDEYPIGWRCDPDSPQQLAAAIDEICRAPEILSEKTPREIFLKNYSEDVVLGQISASLRSIVDLHG
jgi:glycosyltransferase involved in cell wall biosynthesis